MPAHRKAAHLVLLNGTAAHDPAKYNARIDGEVTDDRLLSAPPAQNLISFAQAWAEILDMCPPGVLREGDSALVEMAARVHRRVRNEAVMADLEGHELPPIDIRLYKLYEGMLARLGASPVDRARVVAPKPKPATGDFD